MRWRRVTELSEEQKDDLHELYRNEWWTRERERADVDAVLAGSDEIVGLSDADTGKLVAFARVLTDYTYEAFVFDLVVAPGFRETGLGERVVEAILDAPSLDSVEHFELYCLPDLVGFEEASASSSQRGGSRLAGFYERWGFSDDLGDLRLLRLQRQQ